MHSGSAEKRVTFRSGLFRRLEEYGFLSGQLANNFSEDKSCLGHKVLTNTEFSTALYNYLMVLIDYFFLPVSEEIISADSCATLRACDARKRARGRTTQFVGLISPEELK